MVLEARRGRRWRRVVNGLTVGVPLRPAGRREMTVAPDAGRSCEACRDARNVLRAGDEGDRPVISPHRTCLTLCVGLAVSYDRPPCPSSSRSSARMICISLKTSCRAAFAIGSPTDRSGW